MAGAGSVADGHAGRRVVLTLRFDPSINLQARAAAEGRVFVSAYDDPYTIAGQGTIG